MTRIRRATESTNRYAAPRRLAASTSKTPNDRLPVAARRNPSAMAGLPPDEDRLSRRSRRRLHLGAQRPEAGRNPPRRALVRRRARGGHLIHQVGPRPAPLRCWSWPRREPAQPAQDALRLRRIRPKWARPLAPFTHVKGTTTPSIAHKHETLDGLAGGPRSAAARRRRRVYLGAERERGGAALAVRLGRAAPSPGCRGLADRINGTGLRSCCESESVPSGPIARLVPDRARS
jgi:hypothetical protein